MVFLHISLSFLIIFRMSISVFSSIVYKTILAIINLEFQFGKQNTNYKGILLIVKLEKVFEKESKVPSVSDQIARFPQQ